MTDVTPEQRAAVRVLFEEAFAQAKASGKAASMRSAVLKNRLLSLTDHRFREADYGARTFGEFLALFPDLIEVDHSSKPPLVSFRGDIGTSHLATPARPARVRPDLWDAI